jgi:hypothetical protein
MVSSAERESEWVGGKMPDWCEEAEPIEPALDDRPILARRTFSYGSPIGYWVLSARPLSRLLPGFEAAGRPCTAGVAV